MSIGWAVELDQSHARSAAKLRLQSSIEVLVEDGSLWLRGPGEMSDPAWCAAVASLPASARYVVDSEGRLRRPGDAVPVGRLPRAGWLPIEQWLYVTAPPAATAGRMPDRLGISLVRSSEVYEPNLLLCALDDFATFALTAARVRLDGLVFAASRDGRAIVTGEPLPPIRGLRFFAVDNVAAPLGWTCSPSVSPKILHDRAQADIDDLLIVLPDENWQVVRADAFVRATRSAVRQTVEFVSKQSRS